jgi:5-carboxymethyl-2-hydroxymuconate isomerase
MENSSHAVMEQPDAAVRARRSPRVVLALPVKISVLDSPGGKQVAVGRSLVVNQYGCKIESNTSLRLNQIAELTVLATGKSCRGRVVWVDNRPNKHGNYEFALQFDGRSNVWGIHFPAEDPQLEQQPQKLTPAPREEATAGIPDQTSADAGEKQNAAPATFPLVAGESVMSGAVEDLRPEIPTAGKTGAPVPSAPLAPSGDPGTATALQPQAEMWPAVRPETPSATPGTNVAPTHAVTPAERLLSAVRDLVSGEQAAAAERQARDLEDRMTRIQLEVSRRVTEQIQSVTAAQISILKDSAAEFADQSQRALSASLQQFAETADQKARAIQDEAASAMTAAAASVRGQVAEELSKTEQSFVEQCRSLAQQALSSMVDECVRTMSLRIEELNKGFGEMQNRTQEVLLSTTRQLDEHAAKKVNDTAEQFEARLGDVAQRTFTNFQKYSLAELGKKQESIEAAFRQQMQAVSKSSLQEMQGALARVLQDMAGKMRPVGSDDLSASNEQ